MDGGCARRDEDKKKKKKKKEGKVKLSFAMDDGDEDEPSGSRASVSRPETAEGTPTGDDDGELRLERRVSVSPDL